MDKKRKLSEVNGAPSPKRQRNCLELKDKVEAIRRAAKGESQKAIAASYKCGKTQISEIVKNKVQIMELWEGGANASRKKLKNTNAKYADLNEEVWKWFQDKRARNVPVSGPMIQEAALMLAMPLGHDQFTASNGWLQSFCSHHNISCKTLSGERAEVCEDAVADWKQRLPVACEGFDEKDIFNLDETALFYRALPSKSLW